MSEEPRTTATATENTADTVRFELYGDPCTEAVPEPVPLAALAEAIVTALEEAEYSETNLGVTPTNAMPHGRPPRVDLRIQAIDSDDGYRHARTLFLSGATGDTAIEQQGWLAKAWPQRPGCMPGESPLAAEWAELRDWLHDGLQIYAQGCQEILASVQRDEDEASG